MKTSATDASGPVHHKSTITVTGDTEAVGLFKDLNMYTFNRGRHILDEDDTSYHLSYPLSFHKRALQHSTAQQDSVIEDFRAKLLAEVKRTEKPGSRASETEDDNAFNALTRALADAYLETQCTASYYSTLPPNHHTVVLDKLLPALPTRDGSSDASTIGLEPTSMPSTAAKKSQERRKCILM